jgi:hydroxymethylpyrimidine/phosphomethylpyrimidine kinase
VLVVAGIDPCGGAGLTADARTIQVCGGHPLTVPTCATDQDRTGFRAAWATDEHALDAMLEAVAVDGPIAAVKTGMFATPRSVERVAHFLDRHARGLPLIVDPVLSTTAGGAQADAGGIAAALLEWLVPRATTLTPNAAELAGLVASAPDELIRRGARAVLVTGGDQAGDEVVDELWTAHGRTAIRHPRVSIGPVHGTGCALAAVLAAELARGTAIETACRRAVGRVAQWIANTPPALDGLPVALRIG